MGLYKALYYESSVKPGKKAEPWSLRPNTVGW
jgi:hypothetical protein